INVKGEGMYLAGPAEAEKAYRTKTAELHARVKVRITETVVDEDGNSTTNTGLVDTTVGRAMLWQIVPSGLPYSIVNQKLG
ncbi:hypothetical protein AB4344_28165, partial [Vibrio breoganii]